MIARRSFIAGSLALLSQPAWAQERKAERTVRVGVLDPLPPAINAANIEQLRKGLRGAGYSEGRNLAIEYRASDGRAGRYGSLAEELERAGVDVLIARGTQAALGARDVIRDIPIVALGVNDPVDTGLVASFERPGGNVTGIAFLIKDLETRRVDAPRRGPHEHGQSGHRARLEDARRSGARVQARLGAGRRAQALADRSRLRHGAQTRRRRGNRAARNARRAAARAGRRARRAPSPAGDLHRAPVRRRRRPSFVRGRRRAALLPRRHLRRQARERRQARRARDGGAAQVRAGHQPQDAALARPGDPARPAAALERNRLTGRLRGP